MLGDSDRYGPVMGPLLRPQPEREFASGQPLHDKLPALRQLSIESAFGHALVIDRDMATCCLAGLWLYHHFLDQSHTLSQRIASPAGSYWHGIMHRREGDFSNAKYWFRQANDAQMLDHIWRNVQSGLATFTDFNAPFDLATAWQPARLVDLCQRAAQGDPSVAVLSRLEWQGLFDFCYDRAVKPPDATPSPAK